MDGSSGNKQIFFGHHTTPVSVQGYVTPQRNVNKCGSCSKDFQSAHTLKRHRAYCKSKIDHKKRKRLNFKKSSPCKRQKRNIFAELSSSNSDNDEGPDTISNPGVNAAHNVNNNESNVNHTTCCGTNGTEENSISDNDDDNLFEDNPSHWSSDELQELLNDINKPLEDPDKTLNTSQRATVIIQWLCFFLIYWQLICHISDNGLNWLLQFVFRFLHVLFRDTQSDFLSNFLILFPTSVYMLRRITGVQKDDFQKYVVCPKCLKLYDMKECTRKNIRGETVPVTCGNVERFKRGNSVCGSKLVKEVIINKRKYFYPLKVYSYNSIINQLEALLKKPGFTEKCEGWRQREKSDDVIYDIYDGKMWKNFKWSDGTAFFDQERHYGLIMNIDWFQPFKRRNDYSVGVIYFALANLPREERFKFENIIIAGIIPSMDKEPCLNTFLEPVVEELRGLWKGVKLCNSLTPVSLSCKAALICVACDVPATRKACGFKSHCANYGCSKCYKLFPGGIGEKDYSGFNRDAWPKRTKEKHNRYSKCLVNNKAKKYGIYYSVLTKLSYFDAVTFHVIDPMHNLFLGIAKRTWKIWMEKDFTKAQLDQINKKIEDINLATDVGRIGSNISSNYGAFTAQEWKNWTTIHSIHVLSGILASDRLAVWKKFVLASRIMCQSVITKTEVQEADQLLLEFCKSFETVYGKKAVTPNMHLCCHLKDCLLDYGPVHAFWLFSFERYNGELGSFTTNNRSVEIQYMRKFVTSAYVNPSSGNVPSMYKDDFEEIFSRNDKKQPILHVNTLSLYLASVTKDPESVTWADISFATLPAEYISDALDDDDLAAVLQVYSVMYPQVPCFTAGNTPSLIKKYKYILIGQEKYGSRADCRLSRSARILARWITDRGIVSIGDSSLRPGLVSHYFCHQAVLNGKLEMHVFAVVQWYKKACSIQNSRELWLDHQYEEGGAVSFLPVQRIHSRMAAGFVKNTANSYFCVCPLSRKVFH